MADMIDTLQRLALLKKEQGFYAECESLCLKALSLTRRYMVCRSGLCIIVCMCAHVCVQNLCAHIA